MSGCQQEIKRSPELSNQFESYFSLEKSDESTEVSYSKDFSFSFEEEKEWEEAKEKNEFVGIKIKKEVLDVDLPKGPIYGVSVSGFYELRGKTAFARIVLVDSNNVEWLIFGTDFLFLDGIGDFTNVCDETCVFENPVKINEIRIEGYNSRMTIIDMNFEESASKRRVDTLRGEQYVVRFDKLQDKIEAESLTWQAGETSVSKLMYRDLKKLFMGNELANLNGFQYYKGGIFKFPE